MITFVVQNETNIENFEPLCQQLLQYGIAQQDVQIIHLDAIFGQNTYRYSNFENRLCPDYQIPRPYYQLPPVNRISWLLQNTRSLKSLVSATNVLIIGSDGGVQRCMANTVKRNGGTVILLVDGLLHPWPSQPLKRSVAAGKSILARLSSKIYLNQFFPADIGHSNLDCIYVMNQGVKNVLTAQGVITPIRVVSMPRFDMHIARFREIRLQLGLDTPQRKCLYVTGSFEWHGLISEEKCQAQDIQDLFEFAQHHPEWSIRIRVHPREGRDKYSTLSLPTNVHLSGDSESPIEDLAWASVVVTARSTMAFEAALVGVPVLIYIANFGMPDPNSYFCQDDYYVKSGQLDDVLDWHNVDRLVSISSASSVEVISKEIVDRYQRYLGVDSI